MLSSVSLFSVAKMDPYTSIELDLVQENRENENYVSRAQGSSVTCWKVSLKVES